MSTRLKKLLKSSILRVFPDRPLQFLKRHYYLHSIKNITEEVSQEFKVIKHLVRPADCVMDIGAAIGSYTNFLSKLVGNQGIVYSCEPIPLTFDILSNNVKKLNLTNVKLFNLAISDHEGEVKFEVPKHDCGGENFYESKIVNHSTETSLLRHFIVPCKSLDLLIQNQEMVIRFLKIDVESHELQVVNGAKKLISTSKPAMQIEISGNPESPNSPAKKIFNFLIEQGYSAFWFDGKKLRNSVCNAEVTNYFFLTDQHLQDIQRYDHSLRYLLWNKLG